MKERQLYNLQIINELMNYLLKHPEMRFIQALWAVGIIDRDGALTIRDRFYEEPDETLKKLQGIVNEEYKTPKESEETV